MPRFRRSAYLFFYGYDGELPDLAALLRGEPKLARTSQLLAISIVSGREHAVTRAELDAVLAVPSDQWVDAPPGDRPEVDLRALARKGLLLTDDAGGPLAALRAREEQLAATEWNLYGALYHFLTRWRDVDLRPFAPGDGRVEELPVVDPETVERFVARFGPPPSPFKRAGGDAALELPIVRGSGPLYEVLARRRTTRGFDRSRPLALEELSLVLGEVFGAHGYAPILGEHVGLRKTSPSGGGLHPTEVYPLVSRVEGLDPGLYHYDVARHALELVEALAEDDAVALAASFACGQTYFASAQVSFVLTTRFERSFWKYRRNQRALVALLLDAGHLSQTLYLVAAERGLGAYVTAAINGENIDERLGLDGVREGAIALAGCGLRPAGRSALEPEFAPYVPRETVL